MQQPAECLCGRDILPLCISETRKAHYSCYECGAGFVVDLVTLGSIVMRLPRDWSQVAR